MVGMHSTVRLTQVELQRIEKSTWIQMMKSILHIAKRRLAVWYVCHHHYFCRSTRCFCLWKWWCLYVLYGLFAVFVLYQYPRQTSLSISSRADDEHVYLSSRIGKTTSWSRLNELMHQLICDERRQECVINGAPEALSTFYVEAVGVYGGTQWQKLPKAVNRVLRWGLSRHTDPHLASQCMM